MKTCTRCKNDFEIQDFPIINKRTGKRSSMCTDCGREYDREYHAKNKEKRNELKRDSQLKIRIRNRLHILRYLEKNPCVDCGESDIIVLEFDHQRDKEFNVSNMGTVSINKIQKEIDKCEVVCANCHRRRTAKQFGYYNY